jgi:hypothetical protein
MFYDNLLENQGPRELMRTATAKRHGFFESDQNKAIALTLVFFSVWVVYCLISTELYSDDDLGHYMIARYAPLHPEMFLDVWGRPLFTLLYAPGTQFGLIGGRITSAVIGALVLYLGFLYARDRGYKRPYLFIVLLAFMVRFSGMTFNMDTGLVLCLVLVSALVLYSRDRYISAALVISLAPLARPEGILYTLMFVLLFLYEKRWKAVPFAFAGLFLWNFIPFTIYGDPLWLVHNQPWKNPYGQGEFLHYFKKLSEITGPVQLPFFLAGIAYSIKSWRDKDRGFLAAAWLLYFFFLVISWWLGAFSTVGLTRYFNGTTPITALIALDGLNWLLDSEKGKLDRAVLIVVLAAVVFLGAYAAAGYAYFLVTIILALAARVLVFKDKRGLAKTALIAGIVAVSLVNQYPPFKVPELAPQHRAMQAAGDWYRRNADNRYTLCSDIWFDNFAGIDPYDKTRQAGVTRENLQKAPGGAIVVWEPHYAGGERYGDIPLEDLLYNKSYRPRFVIEETGLFLFEKLEGR